MSNGQNNQNSEVLDYSLLAEMLNFSHLEDIFMFKGQSGQNSEVLSLLHLVLTEVKTLTTNIQEFKSWTRVTDNRLDNIENKIVDFATQLGNLDEKVETPLHDNQQKAQEASQEFRQELLSRFRQLEKDVSFYRKYAQIDIATLVKDIINLEERLEKVELNLESKN